MKESYPISVVVFLLALLAAGGVGTGALRALGVAAASRLERWVFGSAVGLGMLAYLVLAIGLLGLLRPAVLWGLLALFSVAAAPAYLSLAREKRKRDASAPAATFAERAITAALLLYGAALAGLTLIGALAPPTDLDWDSLVYHLAAPKIYLAHGRIHFIAYDSHTNFPFTLQMLYTLGLATGGVATAKLFHWATGWLTVLAIALFTRALAGPRAPAWVPALAAVIFAGIPQVAWEASTAYIDLGTALYQFLALIAFVYAVQAFQRSAVQEQPGVHDQNPVAPDPPLSPSPPLPLPPSSPERLLLLAGLLSGWAMGTKMTAVVPFALLAAWLAWLWLRSRERALLRAGTWFVLAGVLVASPWYLKSYLWTNNPVYPFFYRIFPHSINWNEEADREYRKEQEFFGRGRDLAALLYLPWNLTMHGADFFNVVFKNARPGTPQRHTGNVLGGISAIFLALLPLALFLERWDRRLTWLLVYSGLMVLVWFFLTQQTRYLIPVLAPLSVVVAITVAWLARSAIRTAAALFLGMTFFLHGMQVYAYVAAPAIPVVTGMLSPRDYLRIRQPDLFPALEFINTLPPDTRVAFFQEVRGFYSDRDYFWANPGQNTLVPYEDLPDGRALAAFLKEKLGLTHALVHRGAMGAVQDQKWARLLLEAIDQGALVPIFATTHPQTGRPRVVVYRIAV